MRKKIRIITSLITAFLLCQSICIPVFAEAFDDGVKSRYDEAYYVTTDYYGNLKEADIVKTYAMNGLSAIFDYGSYEEIQNLTDDTEPLKSVAGVQFDFSGGSVPERFYFQAKTEEPFRKMPWMLQVHYLLNGVSTKAEDMVGKTGLAEITVDAVPNSAASDYAKTNYALIATAVFNDDNILSLRADGAQVQLVGNLRTVIFMALPGEEQHFTLQVGSSDFSFGGWTFMMMPVTLGQLDMLSGLGDDKDKIEDSYKKLNSSLDVLLDAVGGISDSLSETANGLDELENGRQIISGGKAEVYDKADTVTADLHALSDLLKPLENEINAVAREISDVNDTLQLMTSNIGDVQNDIDDLTENLKTLSKTNPDKVKDMIRQTKTDLSELKATLLYASIHPVDTVEPLFFGKTTNELENAVELIKTEEKQTKLAGLKAIYEAAGGGYELDKEGFALAISLAGGTAEPGEEAEALFDTAFEQAVPKGENTLSLKEFGYAITFVNEMSQGSTEKQAKASAQETSNALLLNALYQNDPKTLGLVIELADNIAARTDILNSDIENINTIVSGSDEVSGIVAPAASFIDFANACVGEIESKVKELSDAASNGASLGKNTGKLLGKLKKSINEIDDLDEEAQKLISSVKEITNEAVKDIDDTAGLFESLISLAKTAGGSLDKGTEDTLKGLSASLRATAKALGKTDDVKAAKNDISSIIEDVWDDYTGDVNGLLDIDINAGIQSLTSPDNPSPESVQIIIRTQEINKDSIENGEIAVEQPEKGNFFSRIAKMFKDIFASIAGLFS